MTISNDKRHQAALHLRARILAHILAPEHARGLNAPAMAITFGVNAAVISSNCTYLLRDGLVQRFVFARSKHNHTHCLWLSPGADLSLIVLPVKPEPKKRVHRPRMPAEIKPHRTDWREVTTGPATDRGMKRCDLVAAIFGPARTPQ